jgi:hypothetical protein
MLKVGIIGIQGYGMKSLTLLADRHGGTVNMECSDSLPSPNFREKMEFEIFGTKGEIVYSRQDDSEPV